MKKTTWMVAALMGLTAPAAAQEVVTATTSASALERQGPTLAARVNVQGRITRGAPYSAETMSESIQVLANGTRIVRKIATRVYRDAEGRTRTEQLNDNGEVGSVTISDPVQGASYVLNPGTRVAYRTGVIVATPSGIATATVAPGSQGTITTTQTADGRVAIEARSRGTGGGAAAGGLVGGGRGGGGTGATATARGGGGAVLPRTASAAGDTTREDLGQQTIEGVPATGTRTTTVIPAGAIGNDRPIQIVSEQWFSADLQVLVLTRHSDPRVGDTTFKMTAIVRTNPPLTLFEVPSDYKLEQSFIRREVSR